MKRILSTKRLYSLQQYNNIEFFDSIELPENFSLDKEVVDNIRFLQMIQTDLAYRKYLELQTHLSKYDMQTATQYLEELRMNTLDEIQEILNFENK